MSIKELVKNKTYDRIEIHMELPGNVFGHNNKMPVCIAKSINGKLMLPEDSLCTEDTEIVKSKEWSNETVAKGLTVVI